jgi:hypothetical protein
MSRLKKQTLLVLVMLVSVFAFFSVSSPSQVASTGDCTKAKSHLIMIGSDAKITDGCDPAVVSKSKHHRIVWKSANSEPIKIVFNLSPGQQNPFPNMDCPGNSDICSSGPINPSLKFPESPKRLHYKYSVSVFKPGQTKPVAKTDPGAEIEP